MMVSVSVASGYPTRHPRSSHVAGMAPSNYGTRLAMQYYYYLSLTKLMSASFLTFIHHSLAVSTVPVLQCHVYNIQHQDLLL